MTPCSASLVGAFNQISHNLAGVGPGDVFSAWMNEHR